MSYADYYRYFSTLESEVNRLCASLDRCMIWEHLRKGMLPEEFLALIAKCPSERTTDLYDIRALVPIYITSYYAHQTR